MITKKTKLVTKDVAVAKPALRPPLPKEHGAWAMLLIPFVVSIIVTGRWDASLLLLLVALLALYLARFSLSQWIRSRNRRNQKDNLFHWPVIYSALGLGTGAILVFGYKLWALLPMAGIAILSLALYLLLVSRRRDRSWPAELFGVATLTMSGWASFYTTTGSLQITGLIIWLVCFLYFGSSVFFVKMKVEGRPRNGIPFTPRQKLASGRAVGVFQVLTLVAILSLTLAGQTPLLAIAAFVPITTHRTLGIVTLRQELNIKRLGFTELGHAILFGIILGFILRVQLG